MVMDQNLPYWVAVAVILSINLYQCIQAKRRREIRLPSVGPSGFLLSYYGAFKALFNSRTMLKEGFARHKTFQFPQLNHWQVILSSQDHIEELRRAPDDIFSFIDGVKELLAMEFTVGREISTNPYHIAVVRSQLTRHLGSLIDVVKDEIQQSLNDALPRAVDEWQAVPAFNTIMQVVARTSNRVFVGLPVCRDSDFIDLNIQYTIDVVKAATVINMLPKFIRPIFGPLLSPMAKSLKRAAKHLKSIIEYRFRMYEEYGQDWPNKPIDMLTWLIESSESGSHTVRDLSSRILSINFGAIHSSSMSFTHALFRLAAHPEWADIMREEVKHAIASEGWTKVAISKLWKLDSFFRESLRVDGIDMLVMHRFSRVDYTFADGTFIPKGTMVAIGQISPHRDHAIYQNADVFEPFRFAETSQDESELAKNQMVTTSSFFLPFGHGRHACPGRFFAAIEFKVMMAYILLNYNVKLEEGVAKPSILEFTTAVIPDQKAKVLFRKRK